jgi:predicted metalloprotease with PDZ domain
VLAASYADLDATTGRLTRPLADTADAAQLLYTSTPQFRHDRRTVDYYAESELMWLEVDAIIRRVSAGKRTIDDFVRAFYGPPASGPNVVTYKRADVVAALTSVAGYDWDGFFGTRIDTIAAHPPAAGFEADGWRFEYTAEPTRFMRNFEKYQKQVVAAYSIGAIVSETGDVVDVIAGSPADKAGLAPFQKVLAVGGRRFTPDALHAVIRATAARTSTIPFVVDAFGNVSTVDVVYGGGEKYPRLVRVEGTTDVLGAIVKPRGDLHDR